MRISALSERTGVPVATLKYYLREGLLPPGAPTGRTQARYDESHVDRVRLVRALIESASLSLASVRRVLAALDDPPSSRHDLLHAAQDAMLGGDPTPEVDGDPDDPWMARARELVDARGWACDRHDPLVARLADQLRAVDAAGVWSPDGYLAAVAEAVDRIAAADLATVPPDDAGAVRQAVVGTILTDPVIATLRRLAQREASARIAASEA